MKDTYTLKDIQVAGLVVYLVLTLILVVFHIIVGSFPSMPALGIHIGAGVAILASCVAREQ